MVAAVAHEVDDAKTYAGWGIDYLKYDWCGAARIYKDGEMQAVYQKMGDALRATGVPAVISGAGPSVLALTTDGTLPSGLDLHGFTVRRLPVDPFGVTVEAT